ncbi:UTP--glucose-1-phosphate uridylyltransferase GalU [Hydrogenivirga sp. 128-5-R1-1]|uniref:UTP--glucose-1-phosphate uridylyltransferase GalU n=1 Tax=Hydrogenivirga sp. 128-5-R1-1 TaxID=392423 RepID=UPI00015F37D1|nr:UTP--glucose-1-phosphate uridylyltransferase GalU [Hydrogenivirga sp. 128-5-R1-1]EDP76355.1 UDP-glucose pyrophosphorylase [Hydrogenivirga sp. 128-5-R1-1]
MDRQKVRKAVLPVAGWGTRFLPATKAMPKEMFPIIDKPVIQFIVEELLEAGIENAIFVTGRHKRPIEHHFDINTDLERHLEEAGKNEVLKNIREISHMVNPIYVRQKRQLGLGHAVLTAEPAVGQEPFIVSLGDIILEKGSDNLSKMLDIYNRYGRSVIALFEVPEEEVNKYGIVDVEETEEGVLKVKELVEKPSPDEAPSNLAIVGRYIFTPGIFEKLRKTKPGKGGEIQLTDAMKLLLEEEEIYAYQIEGKVYDTGNPLDYLKTVFEFALKREDIGAELREFIANLLSTQNQLIDRP